MSVHAPSQARPSAPDQARQPPALIPSLSAIADRYDVLLCDVWGVVHNGVRAYAPACDALARFARERGPVVLISNAPRPASAVEAGFAEVGVPREAWSSLVTSGDATRLELERRAPGPVWAIGPERDRPLYRGLGLRFVEGPADAALICCTGPFDDEREQAEDYRERLRPAADRGLPFLCANPDRVVQRGDRLIPCAGAVADVYATLGGEVVMAGKPFAPLYALALAEAGRPLGAPLDCSRVLCIGDGLATDVTGANGQGLDCLFIGAGIHGAETLNASGALDIDRTASLLGEHGLHARYAMAELG